MTFEPGVRSLSLAELVEARKRCRIYIERSVGKIHAGQSFHFDPDVVSYWSQWLGCPKPKMLVIGQDFGDKSYFQKFRGQDDPANETNINLYKLLVHAGLTPKYPPQTDLVTPVFLTNSVLCLKEPPMNSSLRDSWVRECSLNHLRPLVNSLRPRIIVAMGAPAWLAARIALDIKDAPSKIGVAAGRTWDVSGFQRVFAVGHCSGLGIRNRSSQKQLQDWSRIGNALTQLGASN